MLNSVKSLLAARYGERWLNGTANQNGLAEDLSIFEKDIMRVSRKYGIVGRGMYLGDGNEIVASYEVAQPIKTLFDLDGIFYAWWGNRASENISFVEREIADDEVIYHFITGTPTHGHSGRIVFLGREVKHVLHKRLERRLQKLEERAPAQQLVSDPIQ